MKEAKDAMEYEKKAKPRFRFGKPSGQKDGWDVAESLLKKFWAWLRKQDPKILLVKTLIAIAMFFIVFGAVRGGL